LAGRSSDAVPTYDLWPSKRRKFVLFPDRPRFEGAQLSCALAYVDDLVVYSRTLSDHCRDLDRVLTRLSLAGLKAKAEKCQFFVPEIDLRVKGNVIEVGDMVLYRKHELRPGEIKSFKMAYREPLYTVVEKLSDVNYRISGTDIDKKVVHYNNILRVDAPDRSMETTIQTRGVAIPPTDERPRHERRPPRGLQDYIVDPVGSKVA
jgi:hypothetical protein